MLRLFRLIALVLLMASWEAAGDDANGQTGDSYFGCFKNVDAVCSNPQRGGIEQILTWAERLHHRKRDYVCRGGTHPQCCDQGKYSAIDYGPLPVPAGGVPYCVPNGQ
ncbi:hypothetical protein H4Q26_002524 [Puccinia striiformis f. sp. tritici PST-130]|uniref:Hydrophobin n=1 Tax=Puccinia striiformis f. sp. tritici PST-78 TaxID=1165861 RepID=A0A0L0VEF2_9BASI|nr:hypothetical protein Pst134EB_016180 [Puccinia striiformis f. sp. tritici]KAI9603206.1 hypothetical protein H4Q26_002524 [Puccinia striiformis f. sp. tritici PST-130]KNE97648.1 hypothetical protein PSTG_09054 [Puccinia striiformis f. sp. tritici PST-78]